MRLLYSGFDVERNIWLGNEKFEKKQQMKRLKKRKPPNKYGLREFLNGKKMASFRNTELCTVTYNEGKTYA